MASFKLYLDKRRKRKDGTHPLKLIIQHKGTTTIDLNIYLTEDQWSGEQIIGDIKNKKALNNYIDRRLTIAKNTLYDLVSSGKLKKLSVSELKNLIENTDTINDNEENYQFKDHLNKFIANKQNIRTQEIYKATEDKIANFTNINKLTFEDIDISWLRSFDTFMSTTCTVNARGIHMRNIRAVFNDAINEDLISQNLYPFRKFKIKKEETIKRSLTIDQLILLRDYPCEEHQEKYRDIFILIFYLIGINAIDLLHLDKITNGRIEYRRAKTKRLYSIEVLPEAQEIINRYPGEKYLLNFLDTYNKYRDFTKKINHHLKKIGPTEIDKNGEKIINPILPNLTTYYARHTWATIAARLDIPKETIAAALGHGGKTTTDIYIDFDMKKVDEANRKVLEYVRNYKVKKEKKQ